MAQSANLTKVVKTVIRPKSMRVDLSQGFCQVCKKDVYEPFVNVKEILFHPDCFVCHQCLEPFQENQFYEIEDRMLCEFDFLLLHGARCVRCGETITGKFITALGGKWHQDHFTCELCGRELGGGSFLKRQGKPYCKPCNEKLKKKETKAADICDRCKHPILDNKITFNGQQVHAFHFTCTICKVTLSAANCKEHECRLYCNRDYERIVSMRDICFGCRKQIKEERSVTALGKHFHPEHFVCSKCEKPFTSETFFEIENKAFCEYHYNELNGDLCGHCYEPAAGGNQCVRALGRKWCASHFVCVACQIQIHPTSGLKFAEWDSKPICLPCWGELTLDVREAINKYSSFEKKVAGEAKKRLAKSTKGIVGTVGVPATTSVTSKSLAMF